MPSKPRDLPPHPRFLPTAKRIMELFLNNPEQWLDGKQVAARLDVPTNTAYSGLGRCAGYGWLMRKEALARIEGAFPAVHYRLNAEAAHVARAACGLTEVNEHA